MTAAARITAAGLPPEGPVFVLCLTTEGSVRRKELCELLHAAQKPGLRLGLTLVAEEAPEAEQAALPL